MDDRRYVVMVSLNGHYLPGRNTESRDTAEHDAEAMYKRMDLELSENPGVATITIFDREADIDLYHVELVRYSRR